MQLLFLEKVVDACTEREHLHILAVEHDDYERDVDVIPCVLLCRYQHLGVSGHIERESLREFTFCETVPEDFAAMSDYDRQCMESEFEDTRLMLDRMRLRGKMR